MRRRWEIHPPAASVAATGKGQLIDMVNGCEQARNES